MSILEINKKFEYTHRSGPYYNNSQIGVTLYGVPITEQECWILEYADVLCVRHGRDLMTRSCVIVPFRELREKFSGKFWKAAMNIVFNEAKPDDPDCTIMNRVGGLHDYMVKRERKQQRVAGVV